jgi:HK97 family phage portal protein
MQFKQAWKVFWNKETQTQQVKASDQQAFAALLGIQQEEGSGSGYASIGKLAYQRSVVGYRAIKLIADGVGSLKWYAVNTRTEEEIEKHKILDLIKRPNPIQGQASLFAEVVSSFIIDGNAYLEANRPRPSSAPLELWTCRPDQIEVIKPAGGRLPTAYKYTGGVGRGQSKTFVVNQVTGQCDLLHLHSFNPFDPLEGQGAAEVASSSINAHAEAVKWNLNLLKNGARPSGALKVPNSLTEEQKAGFRQFFRQNHQGGSNAGKVMVLEGGADWVEMSTSPKDMDFVNTKDSMSRDIALALGVPPILLGLPGDSTYNNYKEARLALYEDTILPLANYIRDELNRWLAPMFGPDIRLEYDEDSITALAPKREALWDRVEKSTILTLNEKRTAVGYGEYEDPAADELWIPAGLVPLSVDLDDEEVQREPQQGDSDDQETPQQDDDEDQE